MHPSTACARVLVDELIRGGVRHAVLAPGSRSAPLALELADRAARDDITLHVRIDERSAGFLAVGLAMAGEKVAVVCTSGTAVANLHPAVLEARHAGHALILLTADRPPELRGTGANQTIDQPGIFGTAVRLAIDLGVPDERRGRVAYWRSTVRRALRAAGPLTDQGPVHLNVPFRDPLVPDGDGTWPEPLTVPERPGRGWFGYREPGPSLADVLGGEIPERGAVLAGHGESGADTRWLADGLGWPIVAEPTAGAWDAGIPAAPLLLADADFAAAHRPEVLVTVGKPGLSRSVLAWVRSAARHVVVDRHREYADPTRSADHVLDRVPRPPEQVREPGEWLAGWQAAGRAARAAVDAVLDAGGLTEPRLARDLVAALPDGAGLFVGNSRPIRDVEAYAVPTGRVLANRGVSGIDGLVSTALGISAAGLGSARAEAALAAVDPARAAAARTGSDAAARGPAGRLVALLGDLSFLHDHNGLLIPPGEPRPPVTFVVVDNDGGGIFETLESAGTPAFERVFGTPHGLDLAAVARAAGWPVTVISEPADLAPALAEPGVVLVRTDRRDLAALHRRLQVAVSTALHA